MEQQIQSPESRMDETKRWRGEGGGVNDAPSLCQTVSIQPGNLTL